MKLSQRINKAYEENVLKNSNADKVKFIAMKEDIKEALVDGWSMNKIYEHLFFVEEKIQCSYPTFISYCKKYLDGGKVPREKLTLKKKRSGPTIVQTEIKGFDWNSEPNMDELV